MDFFLGFLLLGFMGFLLCISIYGIIKLKKQIPNFESFPLIIPIFILGGIVFIIWGLVE
ncbi:hypothetical protein NMT12_150145 [metagenome]